MKLQIEEAIIESLPTDFEELKLALPYSKMQIRRGLRRLGLKIEGYTEFEPPTDREIYSVMEDVLANRVQGGTRLIAHRYVTYLRARTRNTRI